LKTLFDIGTEQEENSQQTLLLEVGKGHCSIAHLNKQSNSISFVQVVSFDEPEIEERFPELVRSFDGQRFETVVACSAFPQSLLFPIKYFKQDYTALNLVYDLPAQAYFYDRIEEWQMVNAYAVPERIYDTLTETFPNVAFMHCYTPGIKVYNGFVADNQLSVHFTEKFFRVLLKKDMMVHLAQMYPYQAPLDVVYYLLKICHEFGLSQQEVFVILSGLVEKNSILFTELQQYFTNIHFAMQPEIGLPQSPHPHYFFTSIYNLAACVS
jgi:hypothetical protein